MTEKHRCRPGGTISCGITHYTALWGDVLNCHGHEERQGTVSSRVWKDLKSQYLISESSVLWVDGSGGPAAEPAALFCFLPVSQLKATQG